MNTLAHRQARLTRKADTRPSCALCGRRTDTGSEHPILGILGPECAHKVAALPKFLESKGLGLLADGALTIDAVLGSDDTGADAWRVPDGVFLLRDRARRVGLDVFWRVDRSEEPWQVTVWLGQGHGKTQRQRLGKSYRQYRAEFEKRLKLGALQRAEAA